jgi:hypothetical protein
MSGLAYKYAEDIHNNLQMFPVWPVNTSLCLGDYGTLEGNIFNREDSIATRYGITIKTRSTPASVHYDYKSADMVETTFYAKGDVKIGTIIPLAKAGLDISFSGEGAVFFNAAECSMNSIDNKREIFEKITKLYRRGEWNKKYRLITDIVTSGATTILISDKSGASISLEASSPEIPIIDLAKASVGLTTKSEKNIGVKIISDGGLTPLMKLGGIVVSPFPWDDPLFKQLQAVNDIPDAEIATFQMLD